MTRFHEMPDLEAATSVWLREGDIDDLEERVYSTIPRSPVYPLATVQRLGGNPAVRGYLDEARIQVDVWGGVRTEASSITKGALLRVAQKAIARLYDLEGVTLISPVNVFVSGVEMQGGLTWLPDETTGRDRYLFTCAVYGRKLDLDDVSS